MLISPQHAQMSLLQTHMSILATFYEVVSQKNICREEDVGDWRATSVISSARVNQSGYIGTVLVLYGIGK